MSDWEPTEPNSTWLEDSLKVALTSLYDPSVMRTSLLIKVFGLGNKIDPVSALRDLLTHAIESFRPDQNTPRSSRAWRAYYILRRRYLEQISQYVVATDIGLSVRQLQREEKTARQILADHLWTRHNLNQKTAELEVLITADIEQAKPEHAGAKTREQELEILVASVPIEFTDIGKLIGEVLDTIHLLLAFSQVTIEGLPFEHLLQIPIKARILRQALLNILLFQSRAVHGGKIVLNAQSLSDFLVMEVRGIILDGSKPLSLNELSSNLASAEQLIILCQGKLETMIEQGPEPVLSTCIFLPLNQGIPILVIDDNADALQLFERYFTGTPYRFYGVRDASQASAMAKEIRPAAIILDVMMPDKDGWNLLGQLRLHPATQGIPVIICTILAQRDLALALGADDFLRKPVSRQTLLAALDRLLASQSTTSG